MDLAEKRKLSSLIKEIQGQAWGRAFQPRYDKRGLASIYLTQFQEIERIREVLQFPIYYLQIDITRKPKIEDLRVAIPMLIKGVAPKIEFLHVDNVPDTSTSRPSRLREVLPTRGTIFESMPNLQSVVFGRVNLSNVHLRAICTNPLLESVELRDCDVTKSIVNYLAKSDRLQYVLLRRCKSIATKDQTWFRAKVPQAKAIWIT